MMWRPIVWLSEVWRNIKARAVLHLLIGAIAAATFGTVTATDLFYGSHTIEQRRNLDHAGSDVAVVEGTSTGDNTGGIDAGRCLALNGLTGITRAGSERTAAPLELATAPGQPFRPIAVAGPTVAIWDPGLADSSVTGQVWATDAMGERYGTTADTISYTTTGPVSVAGTIKPYRAPDLGARIIYPDSPNATADRCWIQVDPPLTQEKLEALATWFAANAPVVTRPILAADQLRVDPLSDFDSRYSRYLWLAAGVLMGGAWALLSRARRSELALLTSIGAGHLNSIALHITEVALVAAVAWVVGTGAATTIWTFRTPLVTQSRSLLVIAITESLAALTIALALGALTVMANTFGSQLQALKNRE